MPETASAFDATDVFALFKKSVKQICKLNDQNKGVGGNGFLNNVEKNCNIGTGWLP